MGRKAIVAEQGKRVSLGLKVTPDIKNKLDAAARANGRTQSQEAEARLERSFDDDRIERIEAKVDECLTRLNRPAICGISNAPGRKT